MSAFAKPASFRWHFCNMEQTAFHQIDDLELAQLVKQLIERFELILVVTSQRQRDSLGDVVHVATLDLFEQLRCSTNVAIPALEVRPKLPVRAVCGLFLV